MTLKVSMKSSSFQICITVCKKIANYTPLECYIPTLHALSVSILFQATCILIKVQKASFHNLITISQQKIATRQQKADPS